MTDSPSKQTSFFYKNYRGELSVRTVTPVEFYWGSTEYHPEPQWIMKAIDHEKNAVRDFALRDCDFRYYSEFSKSLRPKSENWFRRKRATNFGDPREFQVSPTPIMKQDFVQMFTDGKGMLTNYPEYRTGRKDTE